jgi:hypothetical protein
MTGTTNEGGSCPSNRFNVSSTHIAHTIYSADNSQERKLSSPYGEFEQCLSATNGIVNPISSSEATVSDCWNTCASLGTNYASYKASTGQLLCQCFNSFTGKPTNCGAGNTYVWGEGGSTNPSQARRSKRDLDLQKALLDAQAAPFCPPWTVGLPRLGPGHGQGRGQL